MPDHRFVKHNFAPRRRTACATFGGRPTARPEAHWAGPADTGAQSPCWSAWCAVARARAPSPTAVRAAPRQCGIRQAIRQLRPDETGPTRPPGAPSLGRRSRRVSSPATASAASMDGPVSESQRHRPFGLCMRTARLDGWFPTRIGKATSPDLLARVPRGDCDLRCSAPSNQAAAQ